MLIEFSYGLLAHSTALMADAGHNLSDVLGLAMAWGAMLLGRKAPGGRYTYGLRSSTILAALANAMFLLIACGAIGLEAIERLRSSPAVDSHMVVLVASIGILLNGFCAWLFTRGQQGDLNVRAAYLHMAADAATSFGVVLSALLIAKTGWNWLDPAVSILIVLIIVRGTWGLLRQALNLALNAVPAHIDVEAVSTYLRRQDGVADIHDLHIWGLSTTEAALTVHLVTPGGYPGDAAIERICQTLQSRFHIQHSTIQVDMDPHHHDCSLHA